MNIKAGMNNKDIPISGSLSRSSGPKFAPIVQPNSALHNGLGLFPIITGFPIAAKNPHPISGPNIHGKGKPI